MLGTLSRRLRWALIALVALTAVVTISVIHSARAAAPAPVAVSPAAAQPAPDVLVGGGAKKPTVAFIGDAWTAGTPAGGEGAANVSVVLARQQNWFVLNTAQANTGYVRGTPSRPPFEQGQATQVERLAPQLVVISGGRSDEGLPPDAIRTAAATLYADLRAGLPATTRIVVVGPMWQRDAESAPPALGATRDAIRDAAAGAGLPFVDPIAENWWAGPNRQFLGVDGIHPSDEGHAYEAARLTGVLTALGVLAPSPTSS